MIRSPSLSIFKQLSPVPSRQLTLHFRVKWIFFSSRPPLTFNTFSRSLASSYKSGSMKCVAVTALLVSMSLVSGKKKKNILQTNGIKSG